jgi:hypothetical protein
MTRWKQTPGTPPLRRELLFRAWRNAWPRGFGEVDSASAFLLWVFVSLLATPQAAQQDRSAAAGEKLERSSWFAEVSAEIQRGEYRFAFVPGAEGVWSAPSRAQGFQSRVSAGGIEVVPRDSGAEPSAEWKLVLATKSFGREGYASELNRAALQAADERIELDHGRIAEWFVNEERGLEQGWTIASAPIGVESLWIGLEIGGDLDLRIDAGGRSGSFVDAAGEPRLRYTGLTASDATGRELETHLAPGPEGVGIAIDDAGAVYPLTVDPVLTGPAWTAEGDQNGEAFGWSVSSAGDVNGDGYSDVIVGAPGYSRAFVYLGSAAGLATSAAWTAESDQNFADFGYSVATAGDVNGDGYSDVIIGALYYDNGQDNEGRAFLYLGSSSATGLATSAAWTAESDQEDALFGSSVSTAGDVNGDGYSDVIIGASRYDNGQADEGHAFLYLGSSSATGLATSAAWTAESDQNDASFGYSVATAGDVNGDGYSDVIVGAQSYDNGQADEGRAFLYLGSSSATGLATSAAWTAESDQNGASFGYSVATAGDVNGDGYSDVVVGALSYDNGQMDEGRVFVYLGSDAGLATIAAWTAEGDQAAAGFGISVASAGDVNGDGYGDVIVGADDYDSGQTNEGRAFVYLGSSGGLSPNAAWTAESNQDEAGFGFSVAGAGDVNGDGYGDVIVGAFGYDNAQGRVFVYLGSDGGLSPSASWTVESDQTGSFFGQSVAGAGDVNRDGYSDVVVGAPEYDYGETNEGRAFLYLGSSAGLASIASWVAEGNQDFAEFAYSVSPAGDVNGDGYSDVIVGAPQYDNGQTNEGRAFLYQGQKIFGLNRFPAWTAESNQSSAEFGVSVASAGDVNGDGYSDVIVGAQSYDSFGSNEGSCTWALPQGSPTARPGLPRAIRPARSSASALRARAT